MNKFPQFWYESNPSWGFVETFRHLYNHFKLNNSNDVEDFLTKSKQCSERNLVFGTRSEHNRDTTLKDFLLKHECYEEFIDYCKQVKE